MQLEKLEIHSQCTDLCRGHSSPSFNHINLLTYYFIMNMVWFVIVCMCQWWDVGVVVWDEVQTG